MSEAAVCALCALCWLGLAGWDLAQAEDEAAAPDPGSPTAFGEGVRNFHRASGEGSWLFLMSVPGWMPAMDGEVTAAGIPTSVDLGIDDMFGILEDFSVSAPCSTSRRGAGARYSSGTCSISISPAPSATPSNRAAR